MGLGRGLLLVLFVGVGVAVIFAAGEGREPVCDIGLDCEPCLDLGCWWTILPNKTICYSKMDKKARPTGQYNWTYPPGAPCPTTTTTTTTVASSQMSTGAALGLGVLIAMAGLFLTVVVCFFLARHRIRRSMERRIPWLRMRSRIPFSGDLSVVGDGESGGDEDIIYEVPPQIDLGLGSSSQSGNYTTRSGRASRAPSRFGF